MQELKIKATKLRKQGQSLGEIALALGISKSTASLWLREYPLREEVLAERKRDNGLVLAKLQKDRKSERDIIAFNTAKKDIEEITPRDLFMLGLALYIGEGTKWQNIVRIVNSDHRVIKLATRWLLETCGVDKKNLRLRIHGYPDTDFQKAIEFWSIQTKIPKSQFQSNVVDHRTGKSNKRGTLPFGTAHLNVVGDKRGEISLGLKIRKWMEVVLD